MKSLSSVSRVLAYCVLLGVSSTTFAALSCGNAANCYVNAADEARNIAAGVFKASWDVVGNNTLNVAIEAATTGWVAVGFSKTITMDSTDYVMGGYNSTSASTYGSDYFFNSTGPGCPQCAPVLDSANNLLTLSSSENNGVTTLNFSRLLKTDDSTGDYDLSIGSYALVWAFRNTSANGDDLSKYHSGGRGLLAANVNFVPLPSAFWLLGSALLGLVGLKTKKPSLAC